MRLRPFRQTDVEAVDRIWRKHHANDFSVPDRKNRVTDAVVENENGEVIAYGQVKLFAEAMLILDKDASKRERIEAIKLLMLEAFRGADELGLQQMYCFIKDPAFATLISRHFGFDIVENPGELLFREEV